MVKSPPAPVRDMAAISTSVRVMGSNCGARRFPRQPASEVGMSQLTRRFVIVADRSLTERPGFGGRSGGEPRCGERLFFLQRKPRLCHRPAADRNPWMHIWLTHWVVWIAGLHRCPAQLRDRCANASRQRSEHFSSGRPWRNGSGHEGVVCRPGGLETSGIAVRTGRIICWEVR